MKFDLGALPDDVLRQPLDLRVLLRGAAFRVQGAWFRVQGSGFSFRVQGSGFRVHQHGASI